MHAGRMKLLRICVKTGEFDERAEMFACRLEMSNGTCRQKMDDLEKKLRRKGQENGRRHVEEEEDACRVVFITILAQNDMFDLTKACVIPDKTGVRQLSI